ncbi:MAG: hypothetical protein IJL61_05840 [Bacteroidales bacterium]|nr:hypothetical protein [Bacteroidales bacterium]
MQGTLISLGICVAMPVLIVWLIGRVKQNETDRKAEIMLKAIENGAEIDTDFFKSQSGSKATTIKERQLKRLAWACITSIIGVAFILIALIPNWPVRWGTDIDGPVPTFTILGSILLAIGAALFIVYFTGLKMLAKEMEAEEKNLSQQK